MNNKLYVGNLSFTTGEVQLDELFAQAGTVRESSLMQDRMTGKSRGFAFVTMSTAAEAEEAIRKFNGKDLDGRSISVTIARPKEERPGSLQPRSKFRAG